MDEIGELELRVALICDNCGNRYEWRPKRRDQIADMPCPGCGERRLVRIPILERSIEDWNWVAIMWVLITLAAGAVGVYALVNGGGGAP